MTAGDRPRRTMVVSVGHWEFVLISALFVAIYITRETGAVGGAALRVLDDALIAAALALSLHAAKVTARKAVVHLVLAGAAITIAIIEAAVVSEARRTCGNTRANRVPQLNRVPVWSPGRSARGGWSGHREVSVTRRNQLL